jgi:hypothetical protein
MNILIALLLAAQVFVNPTHIRIKLYNQGTTTVAWTSPDIPLSPAVINCGLEKKVGVIGLAVGKPKIQFDDYILTDKACVLDLSLAPSAPVPDGIYELVLLGTIPPDNVSKDSAKLLIATGPVTVKVVNGLVYVN